MTRRPGVAAEVVEESIAFRVALEVDGQQVQLLIAGPSDDEVRTRDPVDA